MDRRKRRQLDNDLRGTGQAFIHDSYILWSDTIKEKQRIVKIQADQVKRK
jgi:hypothetical protein